jgi:hypothetical protein
MAIILADSPALCTTYDCAFSFCVQMLKAKSKWLRLLLTIHRQESKVTPRAGHFQPQLPLVLSVHVTGVSCSQ